MKNLKFLVMVFLLLAGFYSLALSKSLENQEKISLQKLWEEYTFENQQYLAQLQKFEWALSDSVKKEEPLKGIYEFKAKSPTKAFLFSLILPGAGEFYAKSKIKAGIFFGLEALFWTGYFVYHNKGAKKEDEFKAFADEHWNRQAYHDSLQIRYGIDIDTFTQPYIVSPYDPLDTLYITHVLPPTNDQQYYEMVGKYDQFRFGWEKEAYRFSYLDMRDKSNNYFNKARYTLMATLGNHLLSAFDGALTARMYNKKKDRFSQIEARIRLVQRENELIPNLAINFKF